MSWFTLTILTIILWGVAQVMIKRGFTHLSPWHTYALDTFFTLFLWIPYGIIAGLNLDKIDFMSLTAVIFLGITFAGYYSVLEKVPISAVTPIFSSAPAGTLLISLALFGESLSPLQISAVILTIFGVILLTLPNRELKLKPASRVTGRYPASQTWVFWAILLTVIFSFEPLLFKLIISRTGNGTFMIILSFGQVVAVILWYLVRPVSSIIPKIPKKYFFWTILGVILFNIGTITDALALERGLASLVAPLANLNVAVIVILSVILLKEKINAIKIAGIILALIGMTVIAATGDIASRPGLEATNGKSPAVDNPKEFARVKTVFDGDTVELEDGRRVRLIGIDSPEFDYEKHTARCFAQEAKDMATALLQGQEIEMEKDVSDSDKYGRQLRYIWADGVFINEFLVKQGYAKVLYIPPDTKYSPLFKSAQLEAKENSRGLWKECLK